MGVEKVTVMVLKVDLQCSTCYKKMKKLLCKTPQVRDQIFDEKQNLVTITVVCCSPEKIRDKLCYKGGKVIKSIDIKDPPKPKPKEAEKPKTDDKPKEAGKPKTDDKPKEAGKPKADDKPKETAKPKADDKPKETAKPKADDKPKETANPKADDKPKEAEKKADKPKSEEAPKPAKKPAGEKIEDNKPPQALIYGPPAYSIPGTMVPEPFVQYGYPVNTGWGYGEPSYEGYVVAPYYNGYGRPVPPQPGYNGYTYGYDHNEETPSTCTIV